MGKIFTWSEIEQKKIPLRNDFLLVEKKIRQDLERAKGILGGVVCGSFIWNKHNQRSDIDCVIVYDLKQRKKVFEVLQEINKFALDLNIPLELIPLDSQIVQSSLHHVGISFFEHLCCAAEQGGIIKKNPLPLFCFKKANLADEVYGFIRNKMRRIEKGFSRLNTMDEEELCQFLQKILELPIHLTRQILRLYGFSMTPDTKQVVIEKYTKYAPTRMSNMFKRIVVADEKYTKELSSQLIAPNKEGYLKVIMDLQEIACLTWDFTRANAKKFT
jgi:predicted nucleotidyltransferase